MKPNLLFITIDHGRADSVRPEVMPNLCILANRGWRAERCYTPCPLCVPARTALATGRYPWHNGVTCNEFARGRRTRDASMHEHLAAAGYTLAHVGLDHARLDPPLPQRVGFHTYLTFDDHKKAAAAAGVDVGNPPELTTTVTVREQAAGTVERRYSSAEVGRWGGPIGWFLDFWLADRAAETIPRLPEPWAMFVNLWAPHPPLAVPDDYADLFDPAEIELPANVGRVSAVEPASVRQSASAQLAEGLGEADWRRAWAAHLGLTRLADDAVGRVLAAAPDALTVVASDHGEHLGQHRLYQKMELYEMAVRVPLVVAGPGVAAGRVEAGPVGLLDVVPTLLEAAGAEPVTGGDGVSLWPGLRGGSLPADRVIPLACYGNFDLAPPALQRRGVVRGDRKLIASADGEEWYDLAADPLEMAGADEVPAMREMLPPDL